MGERNARLKKKLNRFWQQQGWLALVAIALQAGACGGPMLPSADESQVVSTDPVPWRVVQKPMGSPRSLLTRGEDPLNVQPMTGQLDISPWRVGDGKSGSTVRSIVSVATGPMTYHGGALLYQPTVYYIWYGNWTNNSGVQILTDLANTLGGSPYFNINTTYYDNVGDTVRNAVRFGKATFDTSSAGTSINDDAVYAIVARAINNYSLPYDQNGIYVVLAASNVINTSGQCTEFCGWHSSGVPLNPLFRPNLAVAFIGNPTVCTTPTFSPPITPFSCGVRTTSPNGNPAADAMASMLAHEIEEVATDPFGAGWWAGDNSDGGENADLCAWNMGTTYLASNLATANVRLGARDFLIQQNFVNAFGGSCTMSWDSSQFLHRERWLTRIGGYWDAQKWVSGDFNGDGRTDMAYAFGDNGKVSIDVDYSTGSSFGHQRVVTQVGAYWDSQKWVAGDFNGDGRSDLANVWNDGGYVSIDVELSLPTGFQWQRWLTRVGSFWDTQKWVAGDFNGDGRADLANIFSDGGYVSIDVDLSNGGSFSWQRWLTRVGGFWDAQKWVAGDFNGDRRADLANVFGIGDKINVDFDLSNGSSFRSQHQISNGLPYWDAQKWLAVDFDGDGTADLANVWNDGGYTSIDIYQSSRTFQPLRYASKQAPFWDSQKWVSGDFNGDHRGDLAKAFYDSDLVSIDVHRR